MAQLVTARTVSVLEPVGDVAEISGRPASRPASLQGVRIGLLDNGQVNAKLFLGRVGELLVERSGASSVVHRQKDFWTRPASDEIYEDLAATCNVVVTGWGSWGSCTTWCIHDSVELEQRGVPTVTVVTQAFTSLAERASKVLGHEELPVVVVGHPVATLAAEAVRAMAERALPEVVRGLTNHEKAR